MLVWFVLRNRLKPEGMLFAAYLALYAFGRFFVSFFREDRDWIGDLNEAQIISLLVLLIVVPLLGFRARIQSSILKSSNLDATGAKTRGPKKDGARGGSQNPRSEATRPTRFGCDTCHIQNEN